MSILFVNGPPFDSNFWLGVQHRLESQNVESHVFDFLQTTSSVAQAAECIKNYIAEHNIKALVAHGFGVPAALQTSTLTPLDHLILSNGPLQLNKKWKKLLKNFSTAVIKQGLHPRISIPVCASSLAFRRLVVNPYVMDRDTIASLCKKNLSSREYRNNTANYLKSLANFDAPIDLQAKYCTLIWGDSDPIFAAKHLNQILPKKSNVSTIYIEGAQHFHPLERPWAIADEIKTILTSRHLCHT